MKNDDKKNQNKEERPIAVIQLINKTLDRRFTATDIEIAIMISEMLGHNLRHQSEYLNKQDLQKNASPITLFEKSHLEFRCKNIRELYLPKK